MQIHTNYKFRKWHPVFPQSHFCALFEVQNTFSFYIRLFLILLRHKLINQQSSQPFTNQENNRRCWQAAMPELTDSCCSAAMFHLIYFSMTHSWGVQQMSIAWPPSWFLPSSPSLLSIPAGELLSHQRAKSRGASLLSAVEGPTGNPWQPLYEAVWWSKWTQHPSTFHTTGRFLFPHGLTSVLEGFTCHWVYAPKKSLWTCVAF